VAGWMMIFFILGCCPQGALAVTTYLVAAWCFPLATRGTVIGVASASGKIGAGLGTLLFPIIESRHNVMFVLAFTGNVGAVAFLLTFLFTPPVTGEEVMEGRFAS